MKKSVTPVDVMIPLRVPLHAAHRQGVTRDNRADDISVRRTPAVVVSCGPLRMTYAPLRQANVPDLLAQLSVGGDAIEKA